MTKSETAPSSITYHISLYDNQTQCQLPEETTIVVEAQKMTKRDKTQVISQIYKFETLSTFIFVVTLISCHMELNRVKQSYFDR